MWILMLLLGTGGQGELEPYPEGWKFTTFQWSPFEESIGTGIDVADIDRDGFADLVVGAYRAPITNLYEAGAAYVFHSPELVRSMRLTEDPPNDYNRYGAAVAIGDIDADGFPDIAVSWEKGGEVRRGPRFEHRIGTFGGGGSIGDGDHIRFADVDRDGYSDLIEIELFSPRNIAVWYGPDMGHKLEFAPTNPPQPFYPFALTTGDINGDGWLDVVVGSPGSSKGSDLAVGAVWCFFGPDYVRSHLIEDPTPIQEGYFGNAVATGDYDHDGFADIVALSRAELCPEAYRCGEGLVFFGPDLIRTHRFKDPFPPRSRPGGTFRCTTGDFNGDGIDDLALATSEEAFGTLKTGSIYIFEGPSFTRTHRRAPVDVDKGDGQSAFALVMRTGDVTGDGLDDLIATAPNGDGPYLPQAGRVHVYDFSTQFAFRSYGARTNDRVVLKGSGPGDPDGSSSLVVDGLTGGTAVLLVGSNAQARALSGEEFDRLGPRMLVSPTCMIDLGSIHGRLEYVLRVPRDPALPNLRRLRFQVLETNLGVLHSSNGVVWTIGWAQ